MPDLHDLLSEEASRQTPSANRPFADLVQARRRRDRGTRLAAMGTAVSVTVAGVALAGSLNGSGRTAVVGDPTPTAGSVKPTDAAAVSCYSFAMAFSFHWLQRQPDGSLSGQLKVKNVSGRSCRLADRPQIDLLGTGGVFIPVHAPLGLGVVGAGRVLPTGYTSTATVRWSSWCGPQTPSGTAQVWVDPLPVMRPRSIVIPLGPVLGEDGVAPARPRCLKSGQVSTIITGQFSEPIR